MLTTLIFKISQVNIVPCKLIPFSCFASGRPDSEHVMRRDALSARGA